MITHIHEWNIMKQLYAYLLLVTSSALFAAAENEDYQQNPPFYYAIQTGAEDRYENFYKGNRVLKHEEYTYFIKLLPVAFNADLTLLKDKHGALHVVIDGCPFHNNKHFRVTTKQRSEMHKIVNKWQKKYGKVTTVCGSGAGGAFAAKIVSAHKKDYRNATVITFTEGYELEHEKGQIQFVENSQHTTVISDNGKMRKRIQRIKSNTKWSEVI